MQENPFKGKRGVRRLLNALRYSLEGLAAAFRHEEAFRLELWLALVLIPAAFFAPVGGTDRILMIASVLLVLIVELLNTAVEGGVDSLSPPEPPLAQRRKELRRPSG